MVSPGAPLAVGVVECVTVAAGVVEEADGAEPWLPVRACEYSILCCRVGARRWVSLAYARNITKEQGKTMFGVESETDHSLSGCVQLWRCRA